MKLLKLKEGRKTILIWRSSLESSSSSNVLKGKKKKEMSKKEESEKKIIEQQTHTLNIEQANYDIQ